jgi:hypothetical protein
MGYPQNELMLETKLASTPPGGLPGSAMYSLGRQAHGSSDSSISPDARNHVLDGGLIATQDLHQIGQCPEGPELCCCGACNNSRLTRL